MFVRTVASIFVSVALLRSAAHANPLKTPQCEEFQTTFPPSSVYEYQSVYEPANGKFIAVSAPETYRADDDGLKLYLSKPDGHITERAGVNDKIADGATVNSTFKILYGKVTFEVIAPRVPGIITAAILISDEHDEIDIELLGGDASHWQTNIFATGPQDQEPMWGVFSSVEDLPNANIQQLHSYTIDWNPLRIIWSVDGKLTRTLRKEKTRKHGVLHYPSHPSRIQLGIWDASSPAGTAEWAKGPVNWNSAPNTMSATIKSLTLECPRSD